VTNGTDLLVVDAKPDRLQCQSMDLARLLADLVDIRAPIAELAAPRLPGLYAIFVTERGALPGVYEGADGLLYIGTSSNLAQREFEHALPSGKERILHIAQEFGRSAHRQAAAATAPPQQRQ
jgi:hypothetical protein